MAEQHASDSGHGLPLIIANGFLPFSFSLNHLVAVYRSAGFEAESIPFDVRNMKNSVTYAETILDYARRARQKTGRRAIVVGLSMGGVSALYALKFLGASKHIKTLVAVGSPLHGSPIAPYGIMWTKFSRAAHQLSPGSKFLHQLCLAPFPKDVRFVSLGGIFDFIAPIPTTRLNEAENYIWCFGHHDLIFNWLHLEVVKLLS